MPYRVLWCFESVTPIFLAREKAYVYRSSSVVRSDHHVTCSAPRHGTTRQDTGGGGRQGREDATRPEGTRQNSRKNKNTDGDDIWYQNRNDETRRERERLKPKPHASLPNTLILPKQTWRVGKIRPQNAHNCTNSCGGPGKLAQTNTADCSTHGFAKRLLALQNQLSMTNSTIPQQTSVAPHLGLSRSFVIKRAQLSIFPSHHHPHF